MHDFAGRNLRSSLALAVAILATGLAPAAEGGTIFTYAGNPYTQCGGSYCTGGPYALHVVFETTLSGSSLNSLPFTNLSATITSFEFTDGSGLTLNNSTPTAYSDIRISTNSSGQVVAWFVGAYTFPADIQMQTNWNSPISFIPGADFSETTASFAGDFGFVANNPGTWATTASSVPEPSTLTLVAAGCFALGIVLTRRRKS